MLPMKLVEKEWFSLWNLHEVKIMEMIVTTHNSMLLHIQKLLILKFLCCNF